MEKTPSLAFTLATFTFLLSTLAGTWRAWVPRYTICCRGHRRTAWRVLRCVWTDAPPGWQRLCNHGYSFGTWTVCLCCAADGETVGGEEKQFTTIQGELKTSAHWLVSRDDFYLQVGQLSERLFTAWMVTLVRSVTSVYPEKQHTSLGNYKQNARSSFCLLLYNHVSWDSFWLLLKSKSKTSVMFSHALLLSWRSEGKPETNSWTNQECVDHHTSVIFRSNLEDQWSWFQISISYIKFANKSF